MIRKLKTTLLLVTGLLFATSCENMLNEFSMKNGKDKITLSEDEDSDRPDWAGGLTDENPHIRGNETSGTTRGGDYGDLYQLLRDPNGVPEMVEVVLNSGEYFVQPIAYDSEGNVVELDLNEEGEVIDTNYEPIEVEFGRLNIVRSPQSVLDQAFDESMKVLAAPGAVLSLDFCGRLTSTYPDPVSGETIVKTIDSPRENMALYQYIMKHMFENTAENNYNNRLGFLGEVPNSFDPLTIAASCFAAGSDKTGTVDIDEVVYIDGFIDCTGLNPILNLHENKYYYNFSEPMLGGAQFQYSRGVYADRYLKIVTLNGDGTYNEEIKSVKAAMEDAGLFTYMWGKVDATRVSGFALAVDDAVQVLDYVHGDSNIEFLPDYVP